MDGTEQNAPDSLERARDREAALRDILDIISRSRDDATPVFDALLKAAVRICGASNGVLILGEEDGGPQVLGAHIDAPEETVERYRAGGFAMDRDVSLGARAIIDRETLYYRDVADGEPYREGMAVARALVEGGIRTSIYVPLISAGKGIGCLNLHHQQSRTYSDDDIALLESFAAQAVIAIENVRQFRELQARLEREAATGEVLEVISQSRDDDNPVFKVILKNAARQCRTSVANLAVLSDDGRRLLFKAAHGRQIGSFRPGETEWSTDGDQAIALAVRSGEIVHIPDFADTDLYRAGDPTRLKLVDEEGIRSVLAVPLMGDNGALGVMALHRDEPGPFSEAEIALIRSFAAQAVIAIENVRQFRELQTRLQREAASREILGVISQSRNDETPVFRKILEKAVELCRAHTAGLNLLNADGTHLDLIEVIAAHSGRFDPGNYQTDMQEPDNNMVTCVAEARTIAVADLADTDGYRSRTNAQRVALVDEGGVRSWLAVPLLRNGVAIGCFGLFRTEVAPFSSDEIALVETFAAQAVIAIENVRQFRAIQTANAELETRLEREAATREVLQVISQSRDDEGPVFDAILEQFMKLCGTPQTVLYLLSGDRSRFDLVANKGKGADEVRRMRQQNPALTSDRDTAFMQVYEQKAPLHFEDIRETERYRRAAGDRREAADATGARTTLLVPLLQGDACIGFLGALRSEVKPYTPDEIALLETFAAQAVIAIENVRQFRELQTRLEREAATREILQVISQSRDDEQPVFDVILSKASQLCNSTSAGLVLGREGEKGQTLAAHLNSHPEIPEIYADGKYPMDPEVSNAARAIIEGRVIHLEDMKDTDAYREDHLQTRRMVDHHGVRTNLLVPLLSKDGGIGALILYKQEVSPYTDDEIALVESFAAQAVIAIENVRQFRELQTRLEREKATSDVLSVISQSRDDEYPVFQAIHESASRLCDAPFSGLFLVDESGENLDLVSHLGGNPDYTEASRVKWPLTKAAAVTNAVTNRHVVHIHDVKETVAYREGDEAALNAVNLEGTRTFLAVPMLTAEGAIGTIGLYRREVRPFTDEQIAIVQTFAAQAVIAIENVRQFRELQTRLERERATADVLSVISQSRDDEQPVFEAILESASRLCGAPLAMLGMVDETRNRIFVNASIGASPEYIEAINAEGISLDDDRHANTRAVISGEAVQVLDATQGELYEEGAPGRATSVDIEGIRTFVAAPIISGGKGIGTIVLFRREVSAFEHDQITLLKSFAAQAAIAIENVRQFRELQTRLEREAASAEILQVISRSRDDDQPVFEVILRKASQLCGSTFAGLFLGREGDEAQVLAAQLNAHPEIPEIYADGKVPMDPERSLIARAIIEQKVIHQEDMRDTDAYRDDALQVRKMVDDYGLRTNLMVPLLGKDGGLGALGMWKPEVSPFTHDQIALVEGFAAQAVIAIENVRQFRELQARLEREKASAEILEVIGRSRDDDGPVFDVVLKNAMRLCDVDHAALCIANDARTEVVLAAFAGWMVKEFQVGVDSWPMDSEQNLVRAVAENRMIHTPDMRDTDLYRAGDETRVAVVDEEGLRTQLVLPLMQSGEAIGSLLLYRRKVLPFDDADIALLETFAAQAVIAIENVRQFKALEATTAEVQTLNAGLEARVEEQVGEIERMGKLKSFLPSAVADAVVSSGSEDMLKSHRALLGILFCDIRGFTAFCETAEPEETMAVLQTYHQEMGRLIADHGAGVDHRMGDGIMVLFNDPLPCDDPAGDAVRLAMAMREKMTELCKGWKKLGHRLGFGVGVSLGYATVGMVGYEGRSDYTASGTAVNLAARLCDKAEDGEILLSPRAAIAVEDDFVCEVGGELELKGLVAPVEVTRVVAERS